MDQAHVAARGAGTALISATGLLALGGALLAACGAPAADVAPGTPTGTAAGPAVGSSRSVTATEAATSGLRISLHPGDIGGVAAPGEALRLALEGPEGRRAEAALRPQGEGAFLTWLRDDAGRRVRPAPGQRLWSSEHGTLEIPELSGRWDLERGVLEGEGPPGAALTIVMWNPWHPGEEATPRLEIGADGRWRLEPPVPLRRATHFYLTAHLPEGHELFLCRQVPLLYAEPGSPWVGVETLWEVEAALALERDGRQIARAAGGGPWSGQLELVLRDEDGRPAPMQPGDLLRATLDGEETSLEIGVLEAWLEDGDVVGRAAPGARLRLGRLSPLGEPVQADEEGRFRIDTEGRAAGGRALPGERFEVYEERETGHQLVRRFLGPELEAAPDEGLLRGRSAPGEALRVVRIAGGEEIASASLHSDPLGRFTATLASAPGDRIALYAQDREAALAEMVVSPLEVALQGDRVLGRAAPFALVDLEVWVGEDVAAERLAAYADEDGAWSEPLVGRGGGLADLPPARVRRVVARALEEAAATIARWETAP